MQPHTPQQKLKEWKQRHLPGRVPLPKQTEKTFEDKSKYQRQDKSWKQEVLPVAGQVRTVARTAFVKSKLQDLMEKLEPMKMSFGDAARASVKMLKSDPKKFDKTVEQIEKASKKEIPTKEDLLGNIDPKSMGAVLNTMSFYGTTDGRILKDLLEKISGDIFAATSEVS